MLRFGPRPIECMGDRFDLLAGLYSANLGQSADELPLNDTSLILTDVQTGDVPESLARSGARIRALPWKLLADGESEGRVNMVALGMVGASLVCH